MSLLSLPPELLALVATFLEKDSDINTLSQVNRSLYSFYILLLYQRNARSGNGSALLWAAKQGIRATAEKSIWFGKCDANNTIDESGLNALIWAAREGHEDLVRLLLALLETGSQVDVNFKDSNGRTAISWAAENGLDIVVKLLLETDLVDLEMRDDLLMSPLSYAAEKGHGAVVKRFLAMDIENLDRKDFTGSTPLPGQQKMGMEWSSGCY